MVFGFHLVNPASPAGFGEVEHGQDLQDLHDKVTEECMLGCLILLIL
jgi:hypothetical protein